MAVFHFPAPMPHSLSRLLHEHVDIAFERDPAARTRWEVLTTYPGVHATLAYRLAHRLWRRGWLWSARALSHLARWLTGVEIHPGAEIGRRFFVDHGMGVVIGETARVGDDVTLYHGVTLGGTTWQGGRRHPTLGSDIVVGAGAKILGPIAIGSGSRIGSNAVVIRDVPEGSVVVGVPGRVVDPGKGSGRGFDPYGHKDRMPDPVARAVDALTEHIESVERRLDALDPEGREELPPSSGQGSDRGKAEPSGQGPGSGKG